MTLVDIGANLAHESFTHDFDAMLERALQAGVQRIVVTGSSRESNPRAAALAAAHPRLLSFTSGVHPHHAEEWRDEEDLPLLRDLAALPGHVALGECGLDYYRDFASRPAQVRAFTAQLALAAELGKPLFLHQREAHADFLPILREHRPQLGAVCVHCFTDTRAALEDYLALDCHIGITGWVCDEKRGAALREMIPALPLQRLLVETDAPYLKPPQAPRRLGGDARRNEPALLPLVVDTLAARYGCTAAALAAVTSANARRFFRLD